MMGGRPKNFLHKNEFSWVTREGATHSISNPHSDTLLILHTKKRYVCTANSAHLQKQRNADKSW